MRRYQMLRLQDVQLEWALQVRRSEPRVRSVGIPAQTQLIGEHMSKVVYRSEVRIERAKGPVRRAYLPAESEPIIFGVHGAVAEHYKVPPAVADPRATTLDYIVGAAAG